MKKFICRKNNIKLISLLNWFSRFNNYKVSFHNYKKINIESIYILFIKWQFQYKKFDNYFNVGLYWEELCKYFFKYNLLSTKLKLILRSNYINYINYFIRKFVKKEFSNLTKIYKKDVSFDSLNLFKMNKEGKINLRLNTFKNYKFKNIFLKIFFFEKSKIFKNSISRNFSSEFCIKVYKDFLYKKSYKIRKFYYISKSYYNFLIKNYKLKSHYVYNNCVKSNLISIKKINKVYNKLYFFSILKNKLNISLFNNCFKLDDICWELNEQLYKFNNYFYNSNDNYFYHNKISFCLNNYYNSYYFRKIFYYSLSLNYKNKEFLYKDIKRSSIGNFNNKKFKKVRSNPLIFKLYNLIYYGRTHNIIFDKLYYKRYNIIYQKLINLFYSIKYKYNYRKLYKNLYNILFFNNKYLLKYKRIYKLFGKIYNKVLNKKVYKKSKGLYMFYKLFNKIYNKIFYLLFILVCKVKRYTKKYFQLSNKIFEYIKVYNKTLLNYKYYNFYKRLIHKIKIKYNKNNTQELFENLRFKTKYGDKVLYYKNLVFNNKFFSKILNNKYIAKNNNKLKNLNKNSSLSYYDFFIKNISRRKKKFLFNINKSYVLSSYQVYNVKFYYSPISFDLKVINKNFIKAIKRFCNVYSISILNLFFNQYMYYNKFKKNYVIKFIIVFLNRFHVNYINKFGKKFNSKFNKNFLLRFNKFFIKIFSEAFTKKRSDYLYLERYIEKTIGNFNINRQNFIKSFNEQSKNINPNIFTIFIKKFNKQFIKSFGIKLENKNKLFIKNKKKILLISHYKRKLYFFYNKLYNLYFYWYVYINDNYLYFINNIYFVIWLSFFFWINKVNFYFLQLYFKNINYLNKKYFNFLSDYSIYKWYFIEGQDFSININNFIIKKISFNWFFLSKKLYIYRSYFNIFDDIKRSYRLKKRKKSKKVPLLLPFYFYKNKGYYYKDGKRHNIPWKKGKTITLIF